MSSGESICIWRFARGELGRPLGESGGYDIFDGRRMVVVRRVCIGDGSSLDSRK